MSIIQATCSLIALFLCFYDYKNGNTNSLIFNGILANLCLTNAYMCNKDGDKNNE